MGSFTIPTILRVVADVASMVIGNWRDYNGDGEMMFLLWLVLLIIFLFIARWLFLR